VIKTIHEIRDPIHVFVRLDPDERQVLNSRPFHGCVTFINLPCHILSIQEQLIAALSTRSALWSWLGGLLTLSLILRI
jgi:hypothetical protein